MPNIDLSQPALAEFIESENAETLSSYVQRPALVSEHAKLEESMAKGAYGRRQLYELIQNSTDALTEKKGGGRISVVLTDKALYCANEGTPITRAGVRAILMAFQSEKSSSDKIGRYGLGFKSVLGVSDRPMFFGRNVSFGFDPAWAAREIRKAVPAVREVPTLRLSRLISVDEESSKDRVLAELIGWATSVVKLPFRDTNHSWLSTDIRRFPGEFLLFSPSVKSLELEDRTKSRNQDRLVPHGGRILTKTGSKPLTVADNGKESDWYVFSDTVRPSDVAMADGGVFAARRKIDIFWAIQSGGSDRDGDFWAYFPLEKETMSLTGIINAAWKLNEDRQNILDGPFNDELISAAVNLVLINLPALVSKTDPGKILEIYPARLQERQDADLRLTREFYDRSREFATVPDVLGILRPIAELQLPPTGPIPDSALDAWADSPLLPLDWAHPSVAKNRDRSARIDQLLVAGQQRSSIKQWLEALVADLPVTAESDEQTQVLFKSSFHAIAAAAAYILDENQSEAVRKEARAAKVVLTDAMQFVSLQRDAVFLPASAGESYEGVSVVHPRLVELLDSADLADSLDLQPVDAASQLKARLSNREMSNFQDSDWEDIWRLVTQVENNPETSGLSAKIISDAVNFVDGNESAKVRTRSGSFKPIEKTLLPGSIVFDDGKGDLGTTIDTRYHSAHHQVLLDLGATAAPYSGGGKPEKENLWYEQYEREAESSFKKLNSGRNPGRHLIGFDRTDFPGPLAVMLLLDKESKCRFAQHLFLLEPQNEKRTFRHLSRTDFARVEMDSQVYWLLKKFGCLTTDAGPKFCTEAVGPALEPWSGILNVAAVTSEIAHNLSLPQKFEELTTQHLEGAFERIPTIASPGKVGSFYAECARHIPPPDTIWCHIGSGTDWFSTRQATVVHSRLDEAAIATLRSMEVPFVQVDTDEDVKALVDGWGLTPSEARISFEINPVITGPETPVADYFKGLALRLNSVQLSAALVPCSSIRVEVITKSGAKSEEREFFASLPLIYYRDDMDRAELLDRVSDVLKIPLTDYERDAVLHHVASDDRKIRLRKIKKARSLPEKLLLCVKDAGVLRRRLSDSLVEALESTRGELEDVALAEAFLSVYGVESLILLKDELAGNGLEVPAKWAGSYPAIRFVKELGFPREFAGFEKSSREAVLDIQGPRDLPPLHDFQLSAVGRIKSLLLSGARKKRGLLSLPTGAGKTRVAVEAVVKTIRDDEFRGPILWVAQSDELCEQAVQTWSEIWGSLGGTQALRINRLWAQNEADEYTEGPQVVVATMQKLQFIIDDPDYEWLKNCTAIIIDEAHLAVTKAYTAILNWLSFGRDSDRCPLLGLTATAFRGGEEETKRLVARFHENRLDAGILTDDPYRQLQEWEVLAQVSHRLLDGSDIELTDSELEELERKHAIPATALNRLADDNERNLRLIDVVKEMDSRWPILLFAVSVENARTLAALLNSEGIPSASISAETAPGARRHYIERFRRGELRVLTNYNVLTTGFDAPAVRAIIVGRPTFSPVVYQQMIGRGLRGPRNGGKEECLIVNVADTFQRFGREPAFREFEYLWDGDQ